MADLPWTKFFWSDWESDEALRQCSLAAQGLWMRMLCICAKGDPAGFLAIAGNPLDVSGVARLAGVSVTEAETLLEELARWGVFSRDRRGCIYSRRMVRDAKKAAIARKNGKNGGNPSLRKTKGISASDNQNPTKGDKPQKPEARSQKEKEELRSSKKKTPKEILSAVLSEAQAAAVVEHRRLKKSPLSERAAELLARKFADAPRTCGLTPSAAADLMIERGWQGFEPAWVLQSASQAASQAASVVSEDDERWRKRLNHARQYRQWSTAEWGPMPGLSGCRAPPHLLEPGDGDGWVEWERAA